MPKLFTRATDMIVTATYVMIGLEPLRRPFVCKSGSIG